MTVRTRRRRMRGQALLEMALIMPLLIVVIMGIFDFSRAIWYYNTLAEAAREGSRYAMVHGFRSASPVGPTDYVTLTQRVRSFTVGMVSNSVVVSPTWHAGSIQPGSTVTVEVSYVYQPLTGWIVGGASLPLRSRSVATIVN